MTDEEDRWVRRRGERVFAPSTRYRVCTQCIMDTSDPEIVFDKAGVCHHCHDYARRVAAEVYPGVQGRQQLAKAVAQIKRDGEGKKYDCILGLSGGVDSTYVAYVTKQLGLRPLAVHLDNGWNSEISVRNIENIGRSSGLTCIRRFWTGRSSAVFRLRFCGPQPRIRRSRRTMRSFRPCTSWRPIRASGGSWMGRTS